MEIAHIRTFREAKPFKPFKLILESERELPVENPFFLGIDSTGTYLIWSSYKGGFQRVNPLRIRDIQMIEPFQKRNPEKGAA